MKPVGFTREDFDVFAIPGLEPRMEALKERVRPKLEAIGEAVVPFLSSRLGEPVYAHVAKHARRTVHPPDDTWVAWATNKRGYKSHPHFQVGLWQTHLFIVFALIYESPDKGVFARNLKEQLQEIWPSIPDHFILSDDHTKPGAVRKGALTPDQMKQRLDRLENVKKAEFLCGIHLDRNDPVVGNPDRLLNTIEETFNKLLPLYRLAAEVRI
jgi:uncharacterized protein YktB (UPF0637 family)